MRDLTGERGDIKALEGELTGFYRLRVMNYRVIFDYVQGNEDRYLRCVFAEQRKVVYEGFQEIMKQLTAAEE